MFKPTFDTPFVCLDDVCNGYVELNPVIWNPSIRREENEKILSKVTKKYFNVSLPRETLTKLSASKDSKEFVHEFKKVI